MGESTFLSGFTRSTYLPKLARRGMRIFASLSCLAFAFEVVKANVLTGWRRRPSLTLRGGVFSFLRFLFRRPRTPSTTVLLAVFEVALIPPGTIPSFKPTLANAFRGSRRRKLRLFTIGWYCRQHPRLIESKDVV